MNQPKRHVGGRVPIAGRITAAALTAAVLSVSGLSLGLAGASRAHSAKLTSVKTSNFGSVLSDGDTVYTLKPSSTPCKKSCDEIWPPVVLPKGVKHPKAGHGVTASKLGTKKVHGVGLQVTYKGKLLFYYFGDTSPGQVNGKITDTWGTWTPVVLSKSSSSSTATTGTGATAGSGGVSF